MLSRRKASLLKLLMTYIDNMGYQNSPGMLSRRKASLLKLLIAYIDNIGYQNSPGMFSRWKTSLLARFENHNKEALRSAQKMQASFLFETRLHFHSYCGLSVPRVGIEPTRYCYHWILNPARLPVPPPRPMSRVLCNSGDALKALISQSEILLPE